MTPHLIGAAEFTAAVPVRGGRLHVGGWHRHSAGLPVLAVHGITAHHQSWARVAAALPGVAVVAPDLRGRGQSRMLPQPARLDDHADDLAAVLDHFEVERALVVGHSMGAFVTARFAQRHPDRLAGALLVDGGLPLPPPVAHADGSMPSADELLGPALARLERRFCDLQEYRNFFREHPAFGPMWDEWVQAYVDYDLIGDEDDLHPSAVAAAVRVNLLELQEPELHLQAARTLPEDTEVLRVDRGLLDELPGLYPADHARALAAALPNLDITTVDGLNHYSILLSRAGAEAVADSIRAALARATGADGHLVPTAPVATTPEGL